jgi:two-component system, LytTR family, sensor kinase
MGEAQRQSEWRRWLWIAAIFAGIGLFDATQTVFAMRAEGMHHYWTRLFFTLLFSSLPWIVAIPFVLWLAGRYPLTEWRSLGTWLAHLGTCAGIGLTDAAWVAGWETWLNPWAIMPRPDPFAEIWLHKFYGGLLSYLILYSLILLAAYMAESRQQMVRQQMETARLNEQLSKAQLNALRRQIEPHFLFNTLNAIVGLVRERDTDGAVNMIVGLSDFLRRVVESSDRQQVPLAEELEFTRKYLDIQKARFAERLKFSVDVPAELLRAQVPSLILQPMVENAVKHGIAKRVEGGTIRISACRNNGTLTLRVYNDGPGLPVGGGNSQPGIGIANVRTRLESLYGDAFELSMRDHEPGGVEARVSLPLVRPPGKE